MGTETNNVVFELTGLDPTEVEEWDITQRRDGRYEGIIGTTFNVEVNMHDGHADIYIKDPKNYDEDTFQRTENLRHFLKQNRYITNVIIEGVN